MKSPHLLILFLITLGAKALNAVPTTDGLYARIQTDHGTCYAQLSYDKAPITVANFVGLAEGSRPWINFKTGAISNAPFFDGLLIPRVDPGFVIQMGSPTNTLAGDPGYKFSDEFHPDLTHSAAGILSMANSGPDTNGCQFFITLAAANGLNNMHSVFGNIVEGMDVVTAIGNLEGGSVTIEQITILRIGSEAMAFDPTSWGLPVARDVDLTKPNIMNSPHSAYLEIERASFTEFIVHYSSDLNSWTRYNESSLTHLDSITTTSLDVTSVTNGEPKQFFRGAAVSYEAVPASVNGLTITLNLLSSGQTLALTFTNEERSSIDFENSVGSYLLDGSSSGRIGAYLWTQSLHRGQIVVALEGSGTFYFNLKFNSDGTGIFTGDTSGSSGPFPFYGRLTWAAPL